MSSGDGQLFVPSKGIPVSSGLPQKIVDQITKAELPTGGQHPFKPKLSKNRKGEPVIEKKAVQKGPKKGKRGYVDEQGRIWIKDRSHADVPDHWDVQLDEGDDYFRVGQHGNEIR
jgi:hypothetical protein